MALVSDDKASHLAHVILGSLKQSSLAQLKGDEAQALREIKRVLAATFQEEEAIELGVRARLNSYSRPIVEGSSEWDVLYRKTYEEELRRRKKGST